MTWAHPWLAALAPALAFACALVGMAAAHAARSGARAVGAGTAHLTESISRPRERLRDALLCAGLALLLLALAGPRWGVQRGERLTHGCDAALLIDCSRSMLATDAYPTRSAQARRKAIDLLEASPQMRIALMPFARLPLVRCPFTADHAALAQMIGGCTPGLFPVDDSLQGTDLAAAVRSALQPCANGRARGAAIIVLSDGGDDDDDALARAAGEAAQAGVPIYAILIGDPAQPALLDLDGAPRRVDADPAPLERLAQATGGRCWRATRGDDDVHQLADAIDGALQGGSWRSSADATAVERYRIPLALGMLALALGAMVPTRRRASTALAGAARAAVAMLLLGLSPTAAAEDADGDAEAVAHALALPPDLARAALVAELSAHPRDRAARYDLGTLLLADDPHAAEDMLARARDEARAAKDPTLCGRAMANLAVALARQGQLSRALAIFSDAGGKQPSWTPDLPLGILDTLERERAAREHAGPAAQSGQIASAAPPSSRRGSNLREQAPATIRTARVPDAVAGQPYRARIESQGLGWAAWSATALPAGLSIDSDPDQPDLAWITGTPLAPVRTFVVLNAREGHGAAQAKIAFVVVDTLAVATLELPQATMGVAYRAQLSLRGPERDYAWSAGDIDGLAVHADGAISGVPVAAGALSLLVTARGGDLRTSATVLLPVAAWPEIMVPPTLALQARRPYAQLLEAAGGTPPLRWSLGSGALLPGLALASDGTLSGACAGSGHAQVRLRIVDRWGATAERTVDIVVSDTPQAQQQQQASQPQSQQRQQASQPQTQQPQTPEPQSQQQHTSQQQAQQRSSQGQQATAQQPSQSSPQQRSQNPQRDAGSQQQPNAQQQGQGSQAGSRSGMDAHGEHDTGIAAGHTRESDERDARHWLASLPDEDEAALRNDLMQQPATGPKKNPW